MRARLILLLAVLAPGALAGSAAERFRCDGAARETVAVSHVGDRLDLALADGRIVYFPLIEPPRPSPTLPDRPAEVARELTSLVAGKSASMQKLGEGDRWGRIPVSLVVEGGDEPLDATLVASGLVMTRVEPGACGADTLRAAETEARAAGLGLWADPDFGVLALDRPVDAGGRAGAMTLVEGVVTSIGRTPRRHYLNFAARRGGVSLTIASRNLPLFERAGISEAYLVHKFIRARGVLEIGASAQIELFHPAQIEAIEDRGAAHP